MGDGGVSDRSGTIHSIAVQPSVHPHGQTAPLISNNYLLNLEECFVPAKNEATVDIKSITAPEKAPRRTY